MSRRKRPADENTPVDRLWHALSEIDRCSSDQVSRVVRARAAVQIIAASPWRDDESAIELVAALLGDLSYPSEFGNVRARCRALAKASGDVDLQAAADVLEIKDAGAVVLREPLARAVGGDDVAALWYGACIDEASRVWVLDADNRNPSFDVSTRAGLVMQGYFDYTSARAQRLILAVVMSCLRDVFATTMFGPSLGAWTSAQRAVDILAKTLADPKAVLTTQQAAMIGDAARNSNVSMLQNVSSWLSRMTTSYVGYLLPINDPRLLRAYPAALVALPPLVELLV